MALQIGVDYSINSPAICISNVRDREPLPSQCLFVAFKQRKKDSSLILPKNIILLDKEDLKLDGIERISKYASHAKCLIDEVEKLRCQSHDIYIEGYSYASTSSTFSQMCENGGIFRLLASFLLKPTFYEIAPPTIKKFATGKGNAKKDEMYSAWINKGGYDLLNLFEVENKEANPLSDIVDSYFVLLAGSRSKG